MERTWAPNSDEAHALNYIRHIHKMVLSHLLATTRLANEAEMEDKPEPKHFVVPPIPYNDNRLL